MTTAVHVSYSQRAAAMPEPGLTADGLAALDTEALGDLYRNGHLPSMDALDGEPPGRMLAVVGVERTAAGELVRRFAASAAFPWAGKSFAAEDGQRGRGINRIRLLGNRQWYRFTTRVEPSAIDGEPCVLLDYDHPSNPWFIRKVRDELREVSPGLFLGPAMWKTAAGARLVLYFAIDKTQRRS